MAVDLGPTMLAIVGAVFTSVMTGLAGVARIAWKLHTRRMSVMAETLKQLAEAVGAYEKSNHEEHRKVWDSMQGLRAELQLSTQRADHIKAGLHKLEGALGMQVTRVDTYVERMGRVDSKLDRLFAYIDAPKRATDV